MFQFHALIPKHSFQDVVQWHGFNSEGTHAFGTKYYNGHERVKVYRAGILGSIHEIADIHFAVNANKAQFYSKTHELVWLHKVNSGYLSQIYTELGSAWAKVWRTDIYTLVVFNVVTGQLKRYYARIRPDTHAGYHWMRPRLIPAEDDVPVIMLGSPTPFLTTNVTLYKILLNHADETFSMELLVSLPTNVPQYELDDVVYMPGRLINKVRTNVDQLFSFKEQTEQWVAEIVEIDGERPFEFDNDRLAFDGHNFTYIDISGSEIGIFHLDIKELRWKKVKVFNVYRVPVLQYNSCISTMVSCNLQTVCTFTQKLITVDDNLDVLITAYHCENQLPCLKDQCIRVLLSYFAKYRHDLSEHDVCKLLSLAMIAHDYCGRLFL